MGWFRKNSPADGPASGSPAASPPAHPAPEGVPASSTGTVTPAAAPPPSPAATTTAPVAAGSPGSASNLAPGASGASAASAAPPPAAPPAPSTPSQDAQLKQLADGLQNLTKMVQSERDVIEQFQTKVGSMEERMRFLQHVSEVISMNYNPFLEKGEGDVFEGLSLRVDERAGHAAPAATTAEAAAPPPRNPLVEVVPVPVPESAQSPSRSATPSSSGAGESSPAVAHLSADPAPSASARSADRAPAGEERFLQEMLGADVAAPADAGPSNAGSWPRDGAEGAAQAAPASGPTVTVSESPPEVPAPTAIRVRVAAPPETSTNGDAHARRARSAPPPGTYAPHVALAWFEFLLGRVEARHLHALLDYYRDVGWIPANGHEWLVRLASGVTRRPASPAEARARRSRSAKRTRGPSPLDRVRLHRTSLGFLERLFGPPRDEGDRLLLQRDLERLVQEG